jgi:hypothetical protein
LKNQLLVGHPFLPIRCRPSDAKERSSLFLELSPQLLFREGTSGNGLACCSSFVLQIFDPKNERDRTMCHLVQLQRRFTQLQRTTTDVANRTSRISSLMSPCDNAEIARCPI